MKILLTLGASETTTVKSLTTDDIGITDEEWLLMDNLQKEEALQAYVYDLPEQPYWVLDNFDEKE